ncbi:hypothetical protein HD553DRAFT_316525 [Filobasidium floriforme]|uniref:uncharacterized protein n=1 Tax=Filobasidium floriforme TaxID=5210 RepID=UPI001E8DEEF0|nr:uncharacterized protein HD553DRAFT_316525 [Filobasidium floriforme]KAH8080862.1 hypothetical protein HD553DRAFT_316525 [Filobasidium floriforme]
MQGGKQPGTHAISGTVDIYSARLELYLNSLMDRSSPTLLINRPEIRALLDEYARTPLEDLFREGNISAYRLSDTEEGDTFQLRWQLKTTDTTGTPDISFRLIGEVRHSQERQENRSDQRIECARVSRKSLSKWFADKEYPSWMTATIDGLPNREQVWAILDPKETVQETREESQRSLGSPFRSSPARRLRSTRSTGSAFSIQTRAPLSSSRSSHTRNNSFKQRSTSSQTNFSDSPFRLPGPPASANRRMDKLRRRTSDSSAVSPETFRLTLQGFKMPGDLLLSCNVTSNELTDVQKRYLKGLMRNNPQSVSWDDQTTQVEWAMAVDLIPVQNSRIVLRIHFLPNTAHARHSLLGAYHEQGISLSWISQIWPEANYPNWMEAKWTKHPDPHVKSAVRRTFERIKQRIAHGSQVIISSSDSAIGLSDDEICTYQTQQAESVDTSCLSSYFAPNLTASPISYHETAETCALTGQPRLEFGHDLGYSPSHTGKGYASQWSHDWTNDGATVFHCHLSQNYTDAWQNPAKDQPSTGASILGLGMQSLPDGSFPSPADNNPLQEDIADAWTSEDTNYGLVPVSNNCDYSLCQTADDQTFRSPTSDRGS